MQPRHGPHKERPVFLRPTGSQRADWEATPPWLQWLGRKPFRRSLYAWWNLDGAFDGWEYSDQPPAIEQH